MENENWNENTFNLAKDFKYDKKNEELFVCSWSIERERCIISYKLFFISLAMKEFPE